MGGSTGWSVLSMPIVTANLKWLSGYRQPRYRVPETLDALRQVFASSTPLMAGAESVGDPIAVLPVLFHLLWVQELCADLSVPLCEFTVVRVEAGGR